MTRSAFVLSAVVLVSSLGLSASDSPARQSLSGTLVDLTCASDPTKDRGRLRKEHSRRCLLMPLCIDGGYALLTDSDEILRFDVKGNRLARRLIEKHSHTQSWRVSIEGEVQEDQVAVERIRLR